MLDRKAMARAPKLRAVPTKVLRGVRDYMLGEAAVCVDPNYPICPEQESGFLALARVCNDELRRRRSK